MKGASFRLNLPTFVKSDEETASNLDSGVPTVSVTDEAGNTLSAPTAVAGDGAGAYYVDLTHGTHTAELDVLTVVATGVVDTLTRRYTQTLEVVGAEWFSITELRAEQGLEDVGTVPTALLREVRDEFCELADEVCGVAFVPRYHRDQLYGDGSCWLPLSKLRPRSLRSVTIDGTAQTVGDFDIDDAGRLVANRSFPTPGDSTRNVVVIYEHGYDRPYGRLRREALKAVRGEVLARSARAVNNAPAPTQAPAPAGTRVDARAAFLTVLADYVESVPSVA